MAYSTRRASSSATGPSIQPDRYKLFSEPALRTVVLGALAKQLASTGACAANVTATLCLATGKIAGATDREALQAHFDANNWKLFDDEVIRDWLRESAADDYENDVALVVAKILMRDR